MKSIFTNLQRFKFCYSVFFCVIFTWAGSVNGLTFPVPPPSQNVIGHMQWIQARAGDNFSTIGRRYDVGYVQLIEANPGIDPDNVPAGTIIVVPSLFVLPPVPRKGIVISLSELRLYYFPPDGHTVSTYPVGIGRQGWCSPLGVTRVIEKTVNPVWIPPESIKKDRAKDGVFLPNSVSPGPENPLGGYRMRLAIQQQTYLIHGTNDYTGVGRRSSSGCVRMLPEDVEALFAKVSIGTPVNIINTAYKAGWSKDKLYLEVHIPLQEQESGGQPDPVAMKKVVQAAISASSNSGTVFWKAADRILNQQNGVPQVIGSLKTAPSS